MTTQNDFKALRNAVPEEIQSELFWLFSSDPALALHRMVDLAAAQGVTLTTDEVRVFLRAMDDDGEFDDIQLDAVALAAIAAGRNGKRSFC